MGMLKMVIEGASSIGWGIVIAIVVTAIVYLIIYSMYGKDKRFTPISFIVAPILVALLTYQCSLLVGAVKIKNQCDDIAVTIDALVPPQTNVSQWLSDDDTRNTIKEAVSFIPVANHFIDIDAIAAVDEGDSLGNAMMSKANSNLNWYIVRRLLWCLGLVVIGAVLVIKLLSNTYKSQRRQSVRREMKRVSRRPRR